MLLRRRAHEDGDEKASATSSTTPEKRRTTPSRPASPGSASKELRPLKWWSDPAPPSSTTSSSSSQQRALLLLLLLSLGTLVAIGFSASGRRGTASSFDGTTVMNRSALVLERGTLDSNTKTASILSRRTNAHASRPPNNNNKAVKLDIIFRRRGDGRKPNVGAPPPRGGGATRMILPHLLSPHQQQKKKKKKKKNQTSSSATVEGTADYGDLEFNWDDNYDHHKIRRRTIAPNDANRWHKERKAQVRAMNEYHVSETYTPDDELPHEECERVAWKSAPKPLCNAFHEIVLNPGGHRYLGHGYYRDAWLLPNSNDDTATPNADGEDFVLKQMRLPEDDDDTDHSPNAKSFSKIQREAVIMEQLTSSPRIVSTFGHCALSVLSETMPFEVSALIVPNSGHARQSEMNRLPTVQSRNNFTIQQIFDMTLEMSQSIADIHGFAGAIVHGDIHPVQWLRTRDGKLKLNDFNNAEILDWSRERNDYCQADRGTWGGMYRSPEEFLGEPIDDKIDVYSMGNNIYTLLTGLWPFYELSKYEEIQAKVLDRERPYIDERLRQRGYIERSLIEIMERMWKHKPKNRPSIFEVVAFLTHVQETLNANVSRPDI